MTFPIPILPRRRRALQAFVCCLLLFGAGCETMPRGDDPSALEDRARTQRDAGDYRAAAQLYERLGSRGDESRRNEFLLAAAEAWYQSGDRTRAMYNMRSVRRPFPAGMSPALLVMAAAIDIETRRPNDALERLRALPPDVPRLISVDALAVGARAWFDLGQPARAIDALSEREVWLENPGEILANQRLIWEGLRGADVFEIPAEADDTVAGWLALGKAAAITAGDPFAERAALLRWRDAWPDHPAARVLLPALLGGADAISVPRRVALLVPQSGRLEAAGASLRDGFIAAYFDYRNAASDSEIIVYDTAALGAAQAYREAVAAGADFVVGPLLKDEVAEIAMLAPAGPPTLALNYLPEDTPVPGHFYQFALAPEHEAVRIAQRATAEGQQRAVALLPNSDWGQRLFIAFRDGLEELGGQVVAHEYYNPGATDFASVIRPMLHLDRSNARRRALADELGRPLEFEPRRRQDIDFIFIAAQPQQARLIRPQLRFHYAGDLPVYATASAFSPDIELNRDVNGLIIAATPWEIEPGESASEMIATISRYWPERSHNSSSLYAMGYDAWRLVPLLAQEHDDATVLRGMTGDLSLRADGRIDRFPALGRIENGLARPLEKLELPEPEMAAPGLTEPVLPGGSGTP